MKVFICLVILVEIWFDIWIVDFINEGISLNIKLS